MPQSDTNTVCTQSLQCEPCTAAELTQPYCALNQYKQATTCTHKETHATTTSYDACLLQQVPLTDMTYWLYLLVLVAVCVLSFAGMSHRKQLINRIQNNRLDRMVNS